MFNLVARSVISVSYIDVPPLVGGLVSGDERNGPFVPDESVLIGFYATNCPIRIHLVFELYQLFT